MTKPGYLRVGRATHVGRVRGHNEDALFILTTDQLGLMASEESFGLFILADGMGGHKAGEVASMLATRTAAHHLIADLLIPYLNTDAHSSTRKSITEALVEAVEAADETIKAQAIGGGTTLTCALLLGDHAYLAHVGDSRAYSFANATLQQITRDHTLVDRLVEMGQITPNEALFHPQRNVLYRAVGQGDGIEVDTCIVPLLSNSQILLCSDGLWGMVPDDQLAAILGQGLPPQETCDWLIETANLAGGKDNITAVLVAKE